jgi:hypothetical protein
LGHHVYDSEGEAVAAALATDAGGGVNDNGEVGDDKVWAVIAFTDLYIDASPALQGTPLYPPRVDYAVRMNCR